MSVGSEGSIAFVPSVARVSGGAERIIGELGAVEVL
jgi:hypothetical protein